jgi:hypothetical protein
MLRKVKIGGEERPIAFTMNCLASFSKETGIGFADMLNEIPYHAQLAIIYYGLKDGARINKTEFNYTQEDVGDWLGSNLKLIRELIGYFIEDWVPELKNVVSPATSKEDQS